MEKHQASKILSSAAVSAQYLSLYLSALDFWNLYFMKLIFGLDFLSISNLIFTACVASKNQVRIKQKIKFKNQFHEIEI